MTRIALTTAAMLLAMGSAFAGSDHYDPNDANRPIAGVDRAYTASVGKREVAKQADVDTSMTTGSAGSKAWSDPGQGIWGN
ncbi:MULTISPECIES: DUF680 domain-containing protein [unclassified Mesorhizobium]|uniref:DUF680 domain-containing protein n=1 Tax=unclassified Mesorhizobium TaxID=325217 RepID=UPI00112DC68B|nr:MULTISPECIES: DUF680 domain-containing protein [unclassified Mesorhizobium]TPK97404.1 DUF680 domain-containing protein [Mesorhizobium sp. B2-4-16]TPL63477.1 DUF680 domain-containing protein [Mesorhizobium sp. B2-4-3]